MKKDDIIKGINGIRTLKDAQSIVAAAKRKLEIVASRSFGLDMKVQLLPEHQNSKPFDEVGVIVKVNPKKVKVKFPMGTWGIPREMLMVAE